MSSQQQNHGANGPMDNSDPPIKGAAPESESAVRSVDAPLSGNSNPDDRAEKLSPAPLSPAPLSPAPLSPAPLSPSAPPSRPQPLPSPGERKRPNWVEMGTLTVACLALGGGVIQYFTVSQIDGRMKEQELRVKQIDAAAASLPALDLRADVVEGESYPSFLESKGLQLITLSVNIKNNGKRPILLGKLKVDVFQGATSRELSDLFTYARETAFSQYGGAQPDDLLAPVPAENANKAGSKPSVKKPADSLYSFGGSQIEWKPLDKLQQRNTLNTTLSPGQDGMTTFRFIVNRMDGRTEQFRFVVALEPIPIPPDRPDLAAHANADAAVIYSIGDLAFKNLAFGSGGVYGYKGRDHIQDYSAEPRPPGYVAPPRNLDPITPKP